VEFGVVPQDLGAMAKTEFLYIAHCSTVPTTREELEKLLRKRDVKSCEGLHVTDQDNAIREEFERDFK
jgi:hypothetical protein